MKKGMLPPSQRQLAQYLGISASMMNMAQSSNYSSHGLSPATSEKLAVLIKNHLQVQRSGQAGASWQILQKGIKTEAAKIVEKLLSDIKYLGIKLKAVLEPRLKEMIRREQEYGEWLNTLDHMLAKLPDPKTKEQRNDHHWLSLQQAIVSKRLRKNGRLPQARLEMMIETEKAAIRTRKAMVSKLKKEMK